MSRVQLALDADDLDAAAAVPAMPAMPAMPSMPAMSSMPAPPSSRREGVTVMPRGQECCEDEAQCCGTECC